MKTETIVIQILMMLCFGAGYLGVLAALLRVNVKYEKAQLLALLAAALAMAACLGLAYLYLEVL